MANPPQSLANHVRYDPLFHFFLMPVAVITLIATIVHAWRAPSLTSGWLIVVAIAAPLALLKMRLYALRVQDRLIRLEERLRLTAVLADPLRQRIADLSEEQLISLRFACDAELQALVARALDEKLDRKAIKRAIATWRPDYLRV